MTVRKHGRWFILSLNFTFVSWGVLFLVGVTHGIFRRELQDPASLKVIFGAANILHFIALLLLFTAFYNGAAYIVRRQFANRRARRRIEQMRVGGETITEEVRASIHEQEYTSERKARKTALKTA